MEEESIRKYWLISFGLAATFSYFYTFLGDWSSNDTFGLMFSDSIINWLFIGLGFFLLYYFAYVKRGTKYLISNIIGTVIIMVFYVVTLIPHITLESGIYALSYVAVNSYFLFTSSLLYISNKKYNQSNSIHK